MTTLAAALEMFFMGSGLFGRGSRPPVRIIHTFPQLELAAYFGKVKLASIINDSVVPEEQMAKPGKQQKKTYMQLLLDGASTSDSMGFKQFVGGNHLSIESMGVDGERLRGKTADIMLVDEIQELPEAALGNALKVLNQSNYGEVGKGVRVYFGTPRNRGSAFWDMWSKSSQQYFYSAARSARSIFLSTRRVQMIGRRLGSMGRWCAAHSAVSIRISVRRSRMESGSEGLMRAIVLMLAFIKSTFYATHYKREPSC